MAEVSSASERHEKIDKNKRSIQKNQINTESELWFDIKAHQWPIIYRSDYNVHFLGLEKLHPFDAKKWGNIFHILKAKGFLNEDTVVSPREASNMDLLEVHTPEYLKSLKSSSCVASIAEVLPLLFVPNVFLQNGFLRPMRYQVGGTILAGKLAFERGWAINIGGGLHHCSANKGGGFCVYADISLLIQFVLTRYSDKNPKIMIVDLDAHQGNGHARDFGTNQNVYILDVYNSNIYPRDTYAKSLITRKVELNSFCTDTEYLNKIQSHLEGALEEFHPNLIVYNAGTDILKGDPLGCLSISPQGIIKRDECVFAIAKSNNVPIVMLTSGGYKKQTANIIADSILNLHSAGLITGPQN